MHCFWQRCPQKLSWNTWMRNKTDFQWTTVRNNKKYDRAIISKWRYGSLITSYIKQAPGRLYSWAYCDWRRGRLTAICWNKPLVDPVAQHAANDSPDQLCRLPLLASWADSQFCSFPPDSAAIAWHWWASYNHWSPLLHNRRTLDWPSNISPYGIVHISQLIMCNHCLLCYYEHGVRVMVTSIQFPTHGVRNQWIFV